jgi:hypothetical protein
VDDRAPALLPERPEGRPGEEERARQIHGEHLLPLLRRRVLQRGHAEDARAVDDHVEAAEGPPRQRDGPVDVLGASDVTAARLCAAARRPDEGRGLLGGGTVDVRRHDGPATLGQEPRRRPPDTRARARDEPDLFSKRHRISPMVCPRLTFHSPASPSM